MNSSLVGAMEAAFSDLHAQRSALDAQIGALDAALAALRGGAPRAAAARGPRKAGRPARAAAKAKPRGRATRAASGVRAGSLKDYIQRVLSAGTPMSVKDITTGVTKSGFKTKNKTLATSVGIALANMPSVARVSRGVFKLK
ncbi:MAG: hypothetical protein AB7Q17_03840 [Phycisphaerae bacterium]